MVSIGREFIENNGKEDTLIQKEMSIMLIKRDREIKVFKRLSEKLKSAFKKNAYMYYGGQPVCK